MQTIAVPRWFLWFRIRDSPRYKFNSVNEFLTSEYNSLHHYGADCGLDDLQIIRTGNAKGFRTTDNPTIHFRLRDRNRDLIELVYLKRNATGSVFNPQAEDLFWDHLQTYKSGDIVDVIFKVKGIFNQYYNLKEMDRS